jgi:hypothetical protein
MILVKWLSEHSVFQSYMSIFKGIRLLEEHLHELIEIMIYIKSLFLQLDTPEHSCL